VNGRRVVVTGGSMGIGAAAAQALAERGARLVLVARGAEALEAARAALPGGPHEARAFDVSDEEGWRALAASAGELHGLVCAAAVLEPVGPPGSYEPSRFRRTLDVNLYGTLLAIHHCLPALRAAGGAVVTFGGGGGTAPLPRYDAYAASKAAVVRLTENVATDLAGAGVRVNCVAPGFVATRMHETTLAAGSGAAGAEYFERTRRGLAEGGVPATEAAELVCLLLGDPEPVPFTGRLISARWDPWRQAEWRERLSADPDLGTLRRIDDVSFVPAGGEGGA
jgi:NAD(P)-dependent dehydrogenase (short-subunit alcohol dehydrogenase family)